VDHDLDRRGKEDRFLPRGGGLHPASSVRQGGISELYRFLVREKLLFPVKDEKKRQALYVVPAASFYYIVQKAKE
jgi:hypothetical protein